jgi:hypothetical protein
MHCLRAVLALAAIFAYSSVGFAQTRGFALSRGPITAMPAEAPPCQSSICTSVQRYTQTLIVGATEYYYYPDGSCTYEDYGKWTAPTDIAPVYKGMRADTVDVSKPAIPGPTPKNPYTGATCTGGGTYLYAPLYFTWDLHKNTTAIPRQGPTATFSSTWNGKLGTFIDETFEISVPVVHPIGERSVWLGAVAGLGVTTWQQTLVPPEDDQSFDFGGDCVREYVWDVINACHALRGGGRSNFIIHAGSHYTDFVGVGGRAMVRCGLGRVTVWPRFSSSPISCRHSGGSVGRNKSFALIALGVWALAERCEYPA